MTNREWVNNLSNEDFMTWLVGLIERDSETEEYKEPHPRLEYLKRTSTKVKMAGESKKMTNSELEKSLKDISDIVSRQKAEIERLTEENKKLVEEIDLEVDLQTKRKRQIITESQEFIDELVNKNAELQKQVDELTKRAERAEEIVSEYQSESTTKCWVDYAAKQAVKEFVEKLKEELRGIVGVSYIDELLKEYEK